MQYLLVMKKPANKRFIDLTSKRFGRLVVTSFAGNRQWNCLCDCGGVSIVFSSQLMAGKTKSCGCLRREATAKIRKTHGKSGTVEHRAWKEMKRRCSSVNNSEYHNYGGRGIKVCERWLNSFENFLEDMGVRPAGKSLDRIDNNLGYSPDNCRWATKSEQASNKRNNRIINYLGKPMLLKDIAQITGIHFTLIIKRLDAGWSVEDATGIKPKLGQKIYKHITKGK